MKRSKFAVAILFGVLLALVGSSAAFGQDDPYAPGTTTTTTTTPGEDIPTVTVVRGETVDIKGDGCAPGATVTVTFDDGTLLGTFTADANGEFVSTITIPANATIGEHLITATCGDVQQFLKVNVLGESVDNVSPGTLPRTGSSNTGPLVGIGAAAVVLGAAFVYGSRRPRTADSQ
jgi:LPXTG-motif cell wall-anchored protein